MYKRRNIDTPRELGLKKTRGDERERKKIVATCIETHRIELELKV